MLSSSAVISNCNRPNIDIYNIVDTSDKETFKPKLPTTPIQVIKKIEMKQSDKGASSKFLRSITLDTLSFAEYFYEKPSFAEFLTPKNPIFIKPSLRKVKSLGYSKEEVKELSDSSSVDDTVEKFDSFETINIFSKISGQKSILEVESFENNKAQIEMFEEEKNSEVTHLGKINNKFNNCFNQEATSKLMSLQRFERVTPTIEFIESGENVQGNYQTYVYHSLKSFTQFSKIDFESELKKKEKYSLGCNGGKKTLVLDLDETLIHSNFDRPTGEGTILEFTHDKVIYSFEVLIRPGLSDFFEQMSKSFELFVFTASKKEYADRVLEFIDPEKKFIKHSFYREDCIGVKDKVFIKDLRILGNRQLENIILLDNSIYAFYNQISNGVLINSYYKGQEDSELYNVMGYLQNMIANCRDVRQVNTEVFGFSEILNDIVNETKSML